MDNDTQKDDRLPYIATEEELAAIDEGIRSLENEPGITFEEALRRARIRVLHTSMDWKRQMM